MQLRLSVGTGLTENNASLPEAGRVIDSVSADASSDVLDNYFEKQKGAFTFL